MLGLALVALALLIGGGGVAGPAQAMIVEVAAALALGWLLVFAPIDFTERCLRAPILWLLAFAAVVAIQLIPLPPGLWRAIPGKQLEATTADLIGMQHVWRPIALVPENAVRSAIALVPCAAIFLLLYRGSEATLARIGWLFAGFAVINACLGLMQSYGGVDGAYLFETSHRGNAVGLFANRNHFALFEVIGLVWLTAGVRGLRVQGLGVLLGAILAFGLILLAIVASGSRSGAAIGLVTASLLPLFLVPDRWRGWFVILWVAGVAAAIALIAAGVGLYPDSSLGRLLNRYATGDVEQEGRWDYWANTLYVIRQSFPFGTGLGGFVPAYQANEPLSDVSRLLTNHAHNDYLELVLELGLAGAALILAGLAWLALRARRGIATLGFGLTPFHAALLSVLVVAAGSLTDYPVRTYAVAAVLAACLAIVAGGLPRADNNLRRTAK